VSAAYKFLVVGPSWVGDMVMAQALYRALRERAPGCEIHVVAPPWSLPILERMPEVARAVELDVGHGEIGLGRRRALGKRLRTERYGQAIVLPRSAKAALVPWFARVPRRTGYRGEWRYGLLNDVRRLPPERVATVQRFVALGLDADAAPPADLPDSWRPRLAADVANTERLQRVHDLPMAARSVALLPGAEYGPAKRWPAAHFAALAAALGERGVATVVLGSAKEQALGAEIAAAAPLARNLCGATTLGDAVDLLAAAAAAVTNDSGLMHVAAAAGTHVVAIYGSSSPERTPPLSTRATILRTGIACSPCFARECPLRHLRCLTEIAPATVLDAVLAGAAEPA
jgi:heptosyltransferase-2